MKGYRNNYKDMKPNVAKHVGQEIFNATLNGSNAETINNRLHYAGITNPNGSAVYISEEHLSQMKKSIKDVFSYVQDYAPHRLNEAIDMTISMHTGGLRGPWYVKWYVPYALKTGAPLWVPNAEAQKVVQELRQYEEQKKSNPVPTIVDGERVAL
tara:strand:- start:3455 stop:3919 length:465 start_codon:yes stop_codon:yes gene_type:complete